ncbi:hypothetical protein ASG01_00445 [Chryseobacterium sp. Leaf180]|jgi:hypothetical protein|nr:hypothetical protein ASG01_00445 [Chryseobacterium sp. Leaf180]
MFLSIQISCKKGEINSEISNSDTVQKDSAETATIQSSRETSEEESKSFVISCGSGCAMTYNAESVTGKLPDLKVKFKVEMYVDEQLNDTYNEVYLFEYNQSNEIENIHLEGKKDNVLKTLMPDAQRSFKEFAEGLIKKNSKDSPVSVSETSTFIYNKKTDPNTAAYQTMGTSSVKGLQKYSCNQNKIRYVALPAKSDVQLLLAPQDCGDFQYRYYLIAVTNKKVSGELYVEGEWYEPDNEEEKEVRTFSIDRNFNIKVTIKTPDSSIVENYVITDDGKFVKM